MLYSPARILVADTLIAQYKRALSSEVRREGPSRSPIPQQLLRQCMSSCMWRSYESMVLVRLGHNSKYFAGLLKYFAVIREILRDLSMLHTVVALTLTGWMMRLSGQGKLSMSDKDQSGALNYGYMFANLLAEGLNVR
ncbi:hypothetical protein CRENBAI_010606 [Crenichthys baileyi]|uniref:Uncharacterized protein n=1 Tax=Crenichthys baileyi TaxID=28760 RepID=A0AAV9QV30_9TELE